jgi:hypothetical protein
VELKRIEMQVKVCSGDGKCTFIVNGGTPVVVSTR